MDGDHWFVILAVAHHLIFFVIDCGPLFAADSWTFWALIMAAAYTASATNHLVARSAQEEPVRTLEDALKRGTPVCLQRYSVMDDVISKQYPELIVIRKESEQDVFETVSANWRDDAKSCGVAISNFGTFQLYQGQKEINPDCALTTEKRVIRRLPSGFATAVDSGGMFLQYCLTER